ncbi:4'-phosphopantetheinyl transferase superfamily protein [Bacillus cereus]|uniref:4'-phosphopantetheinyl transferase family protein n=1 Tax=Bacillus sp. BB56-3 TaxID=2217831 RepID=UPI0011EF2BC3|nr:4'-phosphopantetheinyl transferase superfamily protein [Bacillus sp. BB56-3]KAA0800291.1 4-phosphopantetheinyl transferase [Bacillus sp. BB56-3]MCU4757471.1 4'-phosphopantetheinyl transferase superfamily protein [Bacillus cereus]
MISVYAVKMPKSIDVTTFNNLVDLVSVEKKKKIASYINKEDAYRTLLGDVMIRSVICKRYKISNQKIRYSYNIYGKPDWIEDKDFYFNISHSGNWIVCIVGNVPVGTDIEQIRPIQLELISQLFSMEEVMDLNSKTIIERINYFYDLWTLKESYVKAIGTGLSTSLNSFTISKRGEGNIIFNQDNVNSTYFFKQYNIDSDYKLSICATSNQFPNEVIQKNINDIIQDILEVDSFVNYS